MHKCLSFQPVTILVAVHVLKAAGTEVVHGGIFPGGLETSGFQSTQASKIKHLWQYNERITGGVNTAGSPALRVPRNGKDSSFGHLKLPEQSTKSYVTGNSHGLQV